MTKTKIIIGSSIGQFDKLEYFKTLLKKGVVHSVPHFFVSCDGEIFEVLTIDKRTDYTIDADLNSKSITIELDNVGYLRKNEKNEFVDIFGTIYNKPENIFKNHFRREKYWVKYSDKQLMALKTLVSSLCEKYGVVEKYPKNIDSDYKLSPIIYRTNITKIYKDVNKSIMEDFTRQILGTIREHSKPNQVKNDAIQPNDFDYQEEIKKFKTQISSRVEITTFNIYPSVNNVVFGGTFTDLTGLNFQMTLDEKDGLYINSDALQVTDDVVERISKLSGYYKNWADEWSNKVISNYSNQTFNNG